MPIKGELKDRRDDGCGYDFEIINNQQNVKIEVKGLSGITGGVQFTSKEWDVAKNFKDDYYLAIIKNVETDPFHIFVQNPFQKLTAKKTIQTIFQVRWNIPPSQINDL